MHAARDGTSLAMPRELRHNPVMLTRIALALACIVTSASAAPRVYVSNERSGDVSVIDAATSEVVQTIHVGKRPRGIVVSRDGRSVYVALSGSPISPPGQESNEPADKAADGIGVIDVASGKLALKLPSGSDPECFSLSRDGAKMYIANEDVDQATVLDVAGGKPIKTLPVGREPEGVATSPDGRFVYVTGETTSDITVIDTARDEVVATFKTSQRPRAAAFVPDGSKAYVTCETAGVVDVVDVKAHKVSNTIKPPPGGQNVRPMGVVIAPDGSRAYVTTGRGGSVLVMDTATDAVVHVIES